MAGRTAPTRELELIHSLAGSCARRASASDGVRTLIRQADFTRLEQELGDRRLLPLIGSRVLAVPGAIVPPGFRGAVVAAQARARASGLAIDWAMRQAVTALAADGIPVLPLKGTTLALAAHGDFGLRGSADVDLLVHREQLDTAVGRLIAEGFSPPPGWRRQGGLPDLHWSLERQGVPRLELHWRVHWYETTFAEDMLERAQAGADGILRPAPDDFAASLLLFYARDGFHGVRLAADLAAWWDRHGAFMPAAFLESYPRRYPALAPALSAAARVAESVVGVPAAEWLGAAPLPTRRGRLAVTLADWTQHGDPDQLRANISLIGGLLGPPGTVGGFVRRELLLKHEGRRRTAVHCVKMAARYALALWQALSRGSARRPETLPAPPPGKRRAAAG